MVDKEVKLRIKAVKEGKGLENIQSGLKKVEAQSKKTAATAKSGFKSMGATWMEFAKGLLAVEVFKQVGRAIVGFAQDSIKAFEKQELAEAKLAAGIKNVANMLGKRTDLINEDVIALKEQAAALQKVTGFADEEITNAQAMLSTFALQKDGLEALTPRLLDMAAATAKLSGQEVDLQNIAVALGKSMTMGAGALSRYGIVMNDVQREAFNLAEGEEKVNILTEILDQNFAGFAEASGKTAAGQMRIITAEIGDLQEEIGEKLLPVWLSLQRAFLNLVRVVTPLILNLASVIEKVSGAVGNLAGRFSATASVIKSEFTPETNSARASIINFTTAVNKGANVALKSFWNWLKNIANVIANVVAPVINEWKKSLAPILQLLGKAIPEEWKQGFNRIKTTFSKAKAAFVDYGKGVKETNTNVVNSMIAGTNLAAENAKAKAIEKAAIETAKAKETADEKKKVLEDFTKEFNKATKSKSELMQIAYEEELALYEKNVEDVLMLAEWKAVREKEIAAQVAEEKKLIDGDLLKTQEDIATAGVISGLEGIKSEISAKIKAWGAEQTAKAFVEAPLTAGASLASIPLIAAATAAGLAAVNAIQLAEGGIVTKPTKAIIGEAGAEAVIPLEKMGNMGGTVNINVGAFMGKPADAFAFAKMVKTNINKIDRRNITV